MKTFLSKNRNLIVKGMLCTAALAAFMLIGATPRAFADHDSACQQRIAKADHRLHEAAEHHGWNSSQAQHARAQLNEAREHCWNTYHKWWDEDARQWRTEHWDEHDHDDRH